MPDKERKNGEKIVAEILRKYREKSPSRPAIFFGYLVFGALILIVVGLFRTLMERAIQ